MPSPSQSELSDSLPANLFATLPPDLKNDRYPNERSLVGKRASIPLVCFLIIFCIGVSATVAWRSYGAREITAGSHPQVAGLAPQAEPVVQTAPDVIGLTPRTTSSPDQRQPERNTARLRCGAAKHRPDRHEYCLQSRTDDEQRRPDSHLSRADGAQRRSDSA
jgi:hypothetical protein